MSDVTDRIDELTEVSAGLMTEVADLGMLKGELEGRRGEFGVVEVRVAEAVGELEQIESDLEDMATAAEAAGSPSAKHREAIEGLSHLRDALGQHGTVLQSAAGQVTEAMNRAEEVQRALGENRVTIGGLQTLIASISEPS